MDAAKSFHSQGNFLAEEIQTRVAQTINRSDPQNWTHLQSRVNPLSTRLLKRYDNKKTLADQRLTAHTHNLDNLSVICLIR